MKIANLIVSALFLVFAILQFNDPDPGLWIIIYLLVSFLCGFAAFGIYFRYVTISGMVLSFIWAMVLFPSVIELFTEHNPAEIVETMKAEKTYIEESRESLGLLFTFGIFSWLWWQRQRR